MNSFYEIEFLKSKPKFGKSKFGGQPDWLTEPEWPISRETGNPMRFICQMKLSEIGYGKHTSKMAYLFITDEDDFVDGTWEADGGENAIILQPNSNDIKTEKITNGPSLYKMVKKLFNKRLVPKKYMSDIELFEREENRELDNNEFEIKNKFNGKPQFIQGKEYPSVDTWNLLIQLDSTNVPFYINFGDAGVGYGFINEDENIAKFIWQGM